ncbi:Pycsar system effector family protein [Chryseolinea lacunae]|uniref:HD domain-containing protein n=1 Tax=Chryseolinea lacunae TaxID=2801331 RepID=A0ABS1KYR1_9BACT|nr:Pycsar system effector family protein [Chryseolinea lacunae]MBL0744372.1 HD domain-containing protein [Chryseolinea lacunae]
MDSEFIRQAQTLAEEIFHDRAFEKHVFHNLEHTRDVVAAATEIGKYTQLSAEDLESVIVAAWLHDVGYKNGSQDHEAASIAIATEWMKGLGIAEKRINDIALAIGATKMPQNPQNEIGKVLCDADLYHLATKACQEKGELLRAEWSLLNDQHMTNEEWIQSNINFLKYHEYKTLYGQSVLEEGKKKNIKKLKTLLKGGSDGVSEKKYRKLEEEVEHLKGKLEKAKTLKPDRGIETMFRTTSHNHIMLSQMVDNKANILITINSIILSLVVSVLVRKLEENPYLTIPTIILITVCLATMVFSILASRPNVSSGKFTRDDIRNKKTNLLFFGNFHAMKLEEYEWSMKEMMKDADYLYGSLIKDIYYLGKVLGRKYRHLRIAYSIFMFGFVVAILSFIVAFQLAAKANL